MSLRQRIARLSRRRGGRGWIEPAGELDGVPMQAHVYEHANGERWALVPVRSATVEDWVAEIGRHYDAAGYPFPPRGDGNRR